MASVIVTNATAIKDGWAMIALAKANKRDVRKIRRKKFVRATETVFVIDAFVIKLKDFRDNSAKNTR